MGYQDNKFLIISSLVPLKTLKVKLKDLNSRFTSFVEVAIDLPTDDLLRVILTKNFSEKHVSPKHTKTRKINKPMGMFWAWFGLSS